MRRSAGCTTMSASSTPTRKACRRWPMPITCWRGPILSSDSQVGTQGRLALLVHCGNALIDGLVEMIDIDEGLMRKEVAFQIAPGSLDVVQFRGVFRQPFNGQPIPVSERGP